MIDEQQAEQQSALTIAMEYFNEDTCNAFAADVQSRREGAPLVRLATAVHSALRDVDRPRTRLVITADLVASVNVREDRTGNEFTTDRGAGVVAAKTMPPNSEGVVDILVPVYWLMSNGDPEASARQDAYIQHVAAHEAVHASIHHIGDEPFDLHKREEFGYATTNFVSMASEQIEEHLAEYLGSQVTGRRIVQSADDVAVSIAAWQDTLARKLPAIPTHAADYLQQGMIVTFTALHVLWKTLAYLAAALRVDNQFDAVPDEIAGLPAWQESVEPWWDCYIELLGRIPMSVEVDIEATDEVVRELAAHLQQWADDIGFDFHDTPEGGFFRIKIWD